jgi:hypothetical protein
MKGRGAPTGASRKRLASFDTPRFYPLWRWATTLRQNGTTRGDSPCWMIQWNSRPATSFAGVLISGETCAFTVSVQPMGQFGPKSKPQAILRATTKPQRSHPVRSRPSVLTFTQVRGVPYCGAHGTSAPAVPSGVIQKPPVSPRGYRAEDCRAWKVSGIASHARVRSWRRARPYRPRRRQWFAAQREPRVRHHPRASPQCIRRRRPRFEGDPLL